MKSAMVGDIVHVLDNNRLVWPALVIRTHEGTSLVCAKIYKPFGEEIEFRIPHSPHYRVAHWTTKPANADDAAALLKDLAGKKTPP